jgi:hypothetical protein
VETEDYSSSHNKHNANRNPLPAPCGPSQPSLISVSPTGRPTEDLSPRLFGATYCCRVKSLSGWPSFKVCRSKARHSPPPLVGEACPRDQNTDPSIPTGTASPSPCFSAHPTKNQELSPAHSSIRNLKSSSVRAFANDSSPRISPAIALLARCNCRIFSSMEFFATNR